MKRLTTLTLFALLLSACGTHYRHGPTAAELHGQRGIRILFRQPEILFGQTVLTLLCGRKGVCRFACCRVLDISGKLSELMLHSLQ